MSVHHELKILLEHYLRQREGTKTFEIRVNDRGYQKGDTITLKCWCPKLQNFNEYYEPLERTIGDVYPIDSERVVFSTLGIKL